MIVFRYCQDLNRQNQIKWHINTAKNLVNNIAIEPEFSKKCKRKVKAKAMFDEKANNDAATITIPLQNSTLPCIGHTYSSNGMEIPKFKYCSFRF